MAMRIENSHSPISPLSLPGLRGNWHAFWAMTKKELIVMTRYPVAFVTSFAQIFLIILVFSLSSTMFTNPNISTAQTAAAEKYDSGIASYGFIIFMFFSDTLWTIGVNLRQEQVQGTLEQLYLSPASKFANLVSRVANLLIWTGSLSIVGALVFGAILGRLPFKNPGLALYLLLFSLSGTFGVGFAFAALTLRLKGTAETIANLGQFAFMILCANFFPFFVLPKGLLFVSRLIPLSYSVDSFRSALMGFPSGFPELAPIQVEIVIVTLFGVLMPLIGYALYRSAEDDARRKGSLGEF
jgi:ABC-2 type transport system permease protein